VTALLGGPVFIALLIRRYREVTVDERTRSAGSFVSAGSVLFSSRHRCRSRAVSWWRWSARTQRESTLLRALSGLWPASPRGSVLLDGRPLSDLPRRDIARRHRVRLARFDDQLRLHRGRNRTYGALSASRALHSRKRRDREAVRLAIARCDIAHLAERNANTLSGGERQRVLIARSLAVEPEFILLDEPTANLDVEHSLEVLDLCRTLVAGGQVVVLATHDLNAVVRYASKVVLIHEGRIVSTGSRDEVLSQRSLEQVFHVRGRHRIGRRWPTSLRFSPIMIRLTLLLALVGATLPGQTILSGHIKDAQGASIEGAEVRLFRQGAGAFRNTASSAAGEYRFERVEPGSFVLEVRKDGFSHRHVVPERAPR